MKKRKWMEKLLVPEGKLRDAMELFPGKTREEVRAIIGREMGKRLLPGVVLAVFFLVLSCLFEKEVPEQNGIVRPSPGMASTIIQMQLELENSWKNFSLEVGPLEYEEQQMDALHQEAEQYLEQVMPGENESLEKVTKALVFPETLPATGGKIYWTTDAPWLITPEGEVLNELQESAQTVNVTAEISYGSECRYFSRKVTVYPAQLTGEEVALRQVQSELKALELASRKDEQFVLPESVQGYRIFKKESTGLDTGSFLLLLSVVLPLFLYSGYFNSLDTRKKERKELAEACYTEFVTKLSLLLAAGSSVRQAFVRLAEEYEKKYGSEHVLSAELKVTKQELDNGCSETVVYEAFGRRIGVLAYRRMASLLTQNVSKGVQGMRNLLLQEAKEVMARDRATIRQKGEQAGTKLLLPMMGLLLLVFALLLVPAFQSF